MGYLLVAFGVLLGGLWASWGSPWGVLDSFGKSNNDHNNRHNNHNDNNTNNNNDDNNWSLVRAGVVLGTPQSLL